ncbi:uncharacterized protein LOC135696018 [Rhopilema esculentum]|uniref:uncharacterized protein LOC135696018 n=1 Tax=Rhopilema esculentum TaxID=499914 RepID=UPI0031DDBFD7
MWTQTTPLYSTTESSNAESKEVKFGTEKPKVNAQVEYSTADKENFKEAKDSSNIENFDLKISDMKKPNPNPLSWNLVIKDMPKKTDRKCLPKKDLQVPSAPQRKKKEPVFTAWFQSTRSDASGGSIVPLSSVPNLADTYRDNKPKPKVIIEKTTAKDTKSVVRVGLQEAFQFAKSDFIRRSRLRMENVKNAKTRVKKKNTKNLQERHLNDAVLTCIEKQSYPPTVEHLFKPKKRHISRKEMLDQNRKKYEALPEVVKRREEEKRNARYQRNRIMMKQFDKKLRARLLSQKKQ